MSCVWDLEKEERERPINWCVYLGSEPKRTDVAAVAVALSGKTRQEALELGPVTGMKNNRKQTRCLSL
jgi:hypothetical protein